jgi:hypothetical protein
LNTLKRFKKDTATKVLGNTRQEAIQHIKSHNEELIKLENQILHTGLRTQTIKDENEKFVMVFKKIKYSSSFKYRFKLGF